MTAVEIEPSSSHSLSKNLSLWSSEGLPLARAVRAIRGVFSSIRRNLPISPIDVLVADPPRAGLSPEVRDGILRLLPRDIS